jgi:hypothetical protein
MYAHLSYLVCSGTTFRRPVSPAPTFRIETIVMSGEKMRHRTDVVRDIHAGKESLAPEKKNRNIKEVKVERKSAVECHIG